MTQWHYIRRATTADVDTCQQIARQCERRWRGSLGFIYRDKLESAARRNLLHVAIHQGQVVGFVLFGRAGGVSIIKSLAVCPEQGRNGIGRALLYSVPTPLNLLCPPVVNKSQDNPAQDFYRAAGLVDRGIQYTPKSHKPMRAWELPILPMLVRGGNKDVPVIARNSGWAYGIRGDYVPAAYAHHIDIPFGRWVEADEEGKTKIWAKYMRRINQCHPVSALVADYVNPEQKPVMLQQIADLKAAGVIRVMVCPKFAGAVADIPEDCIVAVSIPSGYAAYIPPLDELKDRDLHLLGGTPPKWFGSRGKKTLDMHGYLKLFAAYGLRVVSADANQHVAKGYVGEYWSGGKWTLTGERGASLKLATASGINIRQQLHRSHREVDALLDAAS